jgi:propanol-preferring alcohol dehydrogenase
MSTAQCAVLTGAYGEPYQVVEKPLPSPGLDEALVRIDFTGVCHGDVYSRDGGGPAPEKPNRPLTGGHEGIGEILSFGDKSRHSDFQIGDVVGIAWRARVCEICEPCQAEAENHCYEQQIVGMHRNGTFQRLLPLLVLQSFSIQSLILYKGLL